MLQPKGTEHARFAILVCARDRGGAGLEGKRVRCEKITVINITEFPLDARDHELAAEEMRLMDSRGVHAHPYHTIIG